jgi:hypothetical protein
MKSAFLRLFIWAVMEFVLGPELAMQALYHLSHAPSLRHFKMLNFSISF